VDLYSAARFKKNL